MASMNHPTQAELERWLDEGEDPSSETGVHVRACDVCARHVAEARALGDGVRAWSHERVPGLGDDFADGVLARLGLDAPAESSTGAVHEGVAHERVVALRGDAPSAPSTAAPVYSLSAKLRARARVALWPLVAVAAAALLAVSFRGGTPRTQGGANTGVKGEQFLTQLVTPTDDAASAVESEPMSAEVLSVEVDAEHALYAVLEVPGEGPTKSMPLVWIEDDEYKSPWLKVEQPPSEQP